MLENGCMLETCSEDQILGLGSNTYYAYVCEGK